MRVRRATVFFAIFALAVSLGCIRLGFWQLERLRERRETNALVLARLTETPVSLERVPRNSSARFRRATASGTYAFDHEFVLTSRSRNGAPGVHVITPLRISADTAVLVNRGWAYAPDGMRVDLSLFREDTSAVVDGYVDQYSITSGPVATPSVERAVRRLDRDSLSARIPYPLAPFILVQQKDSGESIAVERGTPVRVEPPRLDEGPHGAYAIQWFGFALVGIAGSVMVLQRDRSRRPGHGRGHESAVQR